MNEQTVVPEAPAVAAVKENLVIELDKDLNESTPVDSPKTAKPAVKKKAPIPREDSHGFYTLNGFFKLHKGTYNILRRNMEKKVNTLILGPTGFGKTELVYNMASHLGLPVTIFDMGTMTDPIMGLVGTNTITVENGVTVSRFIKSRFSEAIQRPGIIMLDELSRASLQANNLLFPCLDFRRELSMEYAFNDSEPIKIHPECIFFATANIGSQYSGTNKMDRALLDRFVLMEIDTLAKEQMVEILTNSYKNVAVANVNTMVSIYEQINKDHEEYKISFGLSFRHLRNICHFVADGFTIYDGFHTICKGLAGKEGLKAIETILTTFKVTSTSNGDTNPPIF